MSLFSCFLQGEIHVRKYPDEHAEELNPRGGRSVIRGGDGEERCVVGKIKVMSGGKPVPVSVMYWPRARMRLGLV